MRESGIAEFFGPAFASASKAAEPQNGKGHVDPFP